MKYNKNGWLDTTVGFVRARTERSAIRAELEAHIEDKCDALISAGMAPRDAEGLAIRAMGDPEEVGRALDKAHARWKSTAYIISKACAILACIAAILVLLAGGHLKDFKKYEIAKSSIAQSNVTYAPESIKESHYKIGVRGARIEDDGTLLVRMRVTAAFPWDDPPLFVGNLSVRGGKMSCAAVIDRDGGRVSGGIFDCDVLNGERRWNSWEFDITIEPDDNQVTLFLPENDVLSFTFDTGVGK